MTCGRVARSNIMAAQLTAIILWLGGSVLGLRDIQLSVPEAVGVGASATLGCRWALDVGETLYTVKWYHGAQEFFRFVPKELPNTRVFSQTGISVDVSRSGAQQVVLRGVSRGLSGRYRCEVSADAPFFHTVYKSANMRVVELPETGPSVRAQKSWYSIGDMLRANCSSPPADPPANLTWLLNGQEVKGLDIPLHDTSYARRKPVITDTSLEDANRIIFSPWDAISGYEEPVTDNVIDIPGNIDGVVGIPHADSNRKNKEESTTRLAPGLEQIANKLNISIEEEKSNKSSSFSQLVIRVQSVHFRKGRVNVTCVAHVLSVWSNSGVLILDEERPQIAPVMGSRDSNSARDFVELLPTETTINDSRATAGSSPPPIQEQVQDAPQSPVLQMTVRGRRTETVASSTPPLRQRPRRKRRLRRSTSHVGIMAMLNCLLYRHWTVR